MSARLQRKPPARVRRTQSERTADTRGRILRAVVESISEVGFRRTTASQIADRAGVTWGAVQHHFGGKDGILRAALEDSFARFEERLSDVRADMPLEERVAAFVARAWEHFASPHYRSTFEILLSQAGRGSGASRAASSWQAGMFHAWDRLWRRLFGDAGLAPRRSAELQRFTIAVLSGAAWLKLLGGPDARHGAELALLEQTLVRELDAGRLEAQRT
jgi:AcrR family transcriptional regulator